MTPISLKVLVVAIATALALGGLHGAAAGQNFGSATVAEQYFRVDAEPGLARNGRPVLRGYVHNRSAFHVDKIRLRVDAAGAEAAPTAPIAMGWVNGEIEANGRRYFEVAVPRADAAYRVTVDSFEVRFHDMNG